MVYIHNETFFGPKKEWSTDTCYDTDEPWQYSAKWEKEDTKGHVLYDSNYMKCLE